MRLNRSVLPIASLAVIGVGVFIISTGADSQTSQGLVVLQPTSPGTPQVGNTNITGMSIMGGFRLPIGAAPGRYLTSDGAGNGFWTASLPPNGPAGGDLAGTYPNPILATLASSLNKVSGGVMTSSASNIGVGTASPTARLHVIGKGYFETGFGGIPTVSLAVGDTDTGLNSTGDGLLDIYSNNVRTLSARTGKVGIGTASPSAVLQVNGSTSGVSIFAGDLAPFGSAALQTNLSIATTHAWFAENSNRVASITGGGAAYFAGSLGVGTSTPSAKVHGYAATGIAGFFVSNDSSTGTIDGLSGQTSSGNGAGLYAVNHNTAGFTQGVYSEVVSPAGVGVFGQNTVANNTGFGVYGNNPSATGWAVYAVGRSATTGTKSFVIDHPLDPENKMLLHYSSESPEPQNFYNGIVRTDERGYATITLPDYYEAINRDPRYSLTVIDEGDTDNFVLAKVVRKIKNGQFVIRTNAPNVEVSWEVKAIRNDRWVQEKGAPTEVDKVGSQRGRYLMPSLYGQPDSQGVFYRGPVPAKSSHP